MCLVFTSNAGNKLKHKRKDKSRTSIAKPTRMHQNALIPVLALSLLSVLRLSCACPIMLSCVSDFIAGKNHTTLYLRHDDVRRLA